MKSLRCCLILILFGLSSSVALANGIDPKFVPIGGTGSIVLISPNDPAFQFSFVKSGTVGTVDCGLFGGTSGNQCINPAFTEFVNFSHQTWSAVTLVFPVALFSPGLVFSTLDNAIDPYFANSAFGVLDNGNPFVTFFGIDATHPGILSADSCVPQIEAPPLCTGPTGTFNDHTIYLFDFSILSDVTDMSDAQFFTAQGFATPAPEPATVLLVLAGGLLLFFFKRPTLGWTGSSLP